MTACQEFAIQLPLKAEPLDAVVDHGDERFEGRLLARQTHGGVLQVPVCPPVGSIVFCYVRPDAELPPSVVLEAVVIGSGASSGELRSAVVRWNWVYVKGGLGLLREQLSEVLGLDGPPDPACVVLVSPGVAYSCTGATLDDPEETERRVERVRFAAARADVLARGAAADDPPLARLRAHERVRLEAPCRLVFRDEDARGRIYNIAREGVFVLTDGPLPYEGDDIVVRIMVRANGDRTPIDLCGVVRWRAESPNSARGGGFGVHVFGVRDALDGLVFDAFIDRLLAHHYESESAPSWVPVSSEPTYEIDVLD